MLLRSEKYGECEVDISVEESAVDSFIKSAYSITLDRQLTDDECEELQEDFADRIHEYSYGEGGSRWKN